MQFIALALLRRNPWGCNLWILWWMLWGDEPAQITVACLCWQNLCCTYSSFWPAHSPVPALRVSYSRSRCPRAVRVPRLGVLLHLPAALPAALRPPPLRTRLPLRLDPQVTRSCALYGRFEASKCYSASITGINVHGTIWYKDLKGLLLFCEWRNMSQRWLCWLGSSSTSIRPTIYLRDIMYKCRDSGFNVWTTDRPRTMISMKICIYLNSKESMHLQWVTSLEVASLLCRHLPNNHNSWLCFFRVGPLMCA